MSMNEKQIELTLALIELIIKVGAPAVIKGIQAFNTEDNPTAAEIRALSNVLKEPEDYFK